MGIEDICIIRGEYRKAAETCDRIIALLQNEWGIVESDQIKNLQEKKARLLARASS